MHIHVKCIIQLIAELVTKRKFISINRHLGMYLIVNREYSKDLYIYLFSSSIFARNEDRSIFDTYFVRETKDVISVNFAQYTTG